MEVTALAPNLALAQIFPFQTKRFTTLVNYYEIPNSPNITHFSVIGDLSFT